RDPHDRRHRAAAGGGVTDNGRGRAPRRGRRRGDGRRRANGRGDLRAAVPRTRHDGAGELYGPCSAGRMRHLGGHAGPDVTQTAAAKVTGLPKAKVRVHNHLLGGGFGRRLEVDFITRAVQVAKQVTGPVQVLWSREEDIQHDMYRPYYYERIGAGLDARGMPIAWTHRVTGSSIMARVVSQLFPKTLRVMRAA